MKMHFYNTIAINDLGRKTLLKPIGSTFDAIFSAGINGSLQLMTDMWGKWNIMERAFPNEMNRRGFYEVKEGKVDNLPGFYYRDDGFLLWNAIRKYVESVLLRPDVYGVDNSGRTKNRFQSEFWMFSGIQCMHWIPENIQNSLWKCSFG